MIRYKLVLTALIILALQSCIDLGIYMSDFPLSSPESSVRIPGITGKWEKISDKREESGFDTLEFILFNNSEYIIRSGESVDKSLLRAFSTNISGTHFLNIQSLSESEKEFVFCKYNISEKNVLTIHFIGDTVFKSDPPSTSKKLRKFIKNNLNNPDLFNKEMKFSFIKIVD